MQKRVLPKTGFLTCALIAGNVSQQLTVVAATHQDRLPAVAPVQHRLAAGKMQPHIDGIPPPGKPWTVEQCGYSEVCQVDVTVTVHDDGSCSFDVPDVKDARKGVTKKFLWKIKSAEPVKYGVGFLKLDVNPPGNADLEDDGSQPSASNDSWQKVFKHRTLSFLTYDIYAWYRRPSGTATGCTNNPYGPAVTNRG